MILALILSVLLVVALLVQEFLPPLAMAHDARIFLLPVVLFYGALALPYWGTLWLAFLAGLLWDLYTLQFVDGLVEISLGWSIMLFVVLCSLMHGLRPLFLRGRWEVHCLATGLCTSLIVLAEYLMITFRRGDPVFPAEVWWRVGVPGLVALLIAPVLFFLFNTIARLSGHSLHPESRVL